MYPAIYYSYIVILICINICMFLHLPLCVGETSIRACFSLQQQVVFRQATCRQVIFRVVDGQSVYNCNR